ncbi:MAG: hypothetical protein L0Z73_04295 [Gammaproteobacteria bacterium]|nr:hypothetical protein [Gammaproteobacteria bacterium]
MEDKKELILLVPGMSAYEPEHYLKKLVDGVRDYCDGKGISFNSLDNNETGNDGIRTIQVELENKTKTIEIREIYWSDLRPRLSNEGALKKFLHGFDLLFYWAGSFRTWISASRSKYMLFNTVFTLLLFLIWYYGAVAAAFTAISASPDMLGFTLPDGLKQWFQSMGDSMGSWNVWISAAALMTIFPVAEVIDISYGTKCFLQNRLGLQHKINGRLSRALGSVSRNAGDYSSVTVMAHSFGVVVAAETLADFDKLTLPVQRFITLGGPLELMQGRSDRVRDALERLEKRLNTDSFTGWIDFYSDYDWLCSKTPMPEGVKGFEHRKITTTVPWDQRASGASHLLYYTDWDVMKELLRLS